MPAKYTHDFVVAKLAKEDYLLLTDEYLGSRQFLSIKCPHDHIFETTFVNWVNANVRCKVCNEQADRQKRLITIKNIVIEEGYEILSDNYINALTPLLFKCPLGHEYNASWHHWYSMGRRCAVCQQRAMITYEMAQKLFESLGYTLLTDSFINKKHEMPCICPNGHQLTRSYDQLRTVSFRIKRNLNSNGCPLCFNDSMSGAKSLFWCGGVWKNEYCTIWRHRELKEFIKNRDGYMCLNPYCKHAHLKLSIHHINYDKKDCDARNLVTLCSSCNSLANFDREWHTAWYQTILNKRYGYIY